MDQTPNCCHEGCTRKGEWAVKARIPAKGWSLDLHTPLSIIVGLPLCRDHASEVTLIQTFPDLRQIIAGFMSMRGLMPPDFDRAWTEAIRRTDPEFLEFERQQAGRQH